MENQYTKTKMNSKNHDKHLIYYQSYDFEGLLFGKKGEEFLQFIVKQENNIQIFDIKYV